MGLLADYQHGLVERNRAEPRYWQSHPNTGVMRSSSYAGLEFIPVSLRVSPPCEGGVRGGGPGGTLAWCAVRVRLETAGAPAEGKASPLRSKVLVMPCSPPLTPRGLPLPSSPPIGEESSQGGEKDRSIATNSDHAQQKHASRSRPCSTVNTDSSSPQVRDEGVPAEVFSDECRKDRLTVL